MSQKSKQPRKIQNTKPSKTSVRPSLLSSQSQYHFEPQQYIPPPPNYACNNAPHFPMSNPKPPPPYPSTYYPNPVLPLQTHPIDVYAENYALRSYIQSLENTHRKLRSDFHDVTPILGETKGKTENQPMPLLPIAKDKQSGLNLPVGLSRKAKKKNQASSAKSRVETRKSGTKKFYSNKKGNDSGSSIPLKGQPNPLKGQSNPLKGQSNPLKGQLNPLKGQPNPKNEDKPRPPKETLNQKDCSTSLNDITALRNSLPKDQLKLVKMAPPKVNLKKGEDKSKVGNLYVIINADIDITLQLPKYLAKRLKEKIKFKVKLITKDVKTGYVKLLLEFESQNKMTKAIRFFNASNTNNEIKIECKRVVEDKQSQNKPNTQDKKLKCQNDTVLQQHNKKIENVRNKITSIMGSVADDSSSRETKNMCVQALKHKEKELLFQLIQYKTAQRDLETQLKTLQKDKKDDSEERKKVVKRLFQEQKFLSEASQLYAMRTKLTETVLKNQVTILMGNCGSGKSTQLAQYLVKTSLVDDGPIVVTEPSEAQALSKARHVAGEMQSSLGDLVGFSSEKDIHMNINTNVFFMGEHELLNQFQKMKSFDAYSCIVIDEAQEKTAYANLLLGLLKLELKKIPRLRIVIVTAPMEIGIYQSFFANPVLLEISSCLFPVQEIWCNPDKNDQTQLFENSAVKKAFEVHYKENEGDILVFVASVAEVLQCCTDLKSCMKKDNYVCILPLYNGIMYDQLKSIYKPVSQGKRKIIFATSCAEVMYAVPDVRYIIDNGIKKERFFESGNKNELQISFISRESAEHRKERAGRSFAGKCYRLYSQNDFQYMRETDPDEMSLTGSIEKVIMNLFKLEIDPMKFQFPTRVTEERISSAVKNLENLGVVLNDCGKYKLMDLGAKIFKLPFRFEINWMLLEGIKQGMKMESIALATLSDLNQEVFSIEAKYNDKMKRKHKEFGPPCESIALRTLRVLAAWYRKPKKDKASWCAECFLDNSTLKLINSQMTALCQTLGTELKLDVKFTPLQTIDDPSDLEKLIEKALITAIP